MPKKNILIVEPDNEIVQSLLEFFNNTYSITIAKTASGAIAATGKKQYDCVVLELALHGPHSGLEFLHEFKSYADTRDVPVIIFTMQLLPDKTFDGLQVDYLYKPKTSLQQLATLVAGRVT